MDRITKMLLATIAVGLWANIAMPLLKPTTVNAQGITQLEFENAWEHIKVIQRDLNAIADGRCGNLKICNQ